MIEIILAVYLSLAPAVVTPGDPGAFFGTTISEPIDKRKICQVRYCWTYRGVETCGYRVTLRVKCPEIVEI